MSQKRTTVWVYAVLTTTQDKALEAVALNIPLEAKLEVVGGLARALAKRLRLKPGEPLQV